MCIRDRTNLEIALAADGIKPGKGGAKIYKALETEKGVERAMNKIKDYVQIQKVDVYFGLQVLNHQNC